MKVGARRDAGGHEGSGQGWTWSFLDEAELADPASPMADKTRAFPRNPLWPVFMGAQASSSSLKPPRAPGVCFNRIFLKSVGHPPLRPCICRVMTPRMGASHHPSTLPEAFAHFGGQPPSPGDCHGLGMARLPSDGLVLLR